jgi:iron complex outermembrane receptor protein
MRPSRLLRTLALVAGFTALAAGPALAQQANVTGRVTDAGSGQPVSTVQVTLAGTTLSAQTNSDGVYTLRGVTPGAATVRVVRLGYTDQSRQVTLTSGETTTVNFVM